MVDIDLVLLLVGLWKISGINVTTIAYNMENIENSDKLLLNPMHQITC